MLDGVGGNFISSIIGLSAGCCEIDRETDFLPFAFALVCIRS